MLEVAGDVCQRCGKPHRLLNVAHLTHDPTDREFLAVLCPRCHAKNDTRQRIAMTRRTWAQRRGQLWLSEEIRLAPFPIRTCADAGAIVGFGAVLKSEAFPLRAAVRPTCRPSALTFVGQP
jgi:hypothetical protein